MGLRDDFDTVIKFYGHSPAEISEQAAMARASEPCSDWIKREAMRIRGEIAHPDAIGISARIKNSMTEKHD